MKPPSTEFLKPVQKSARGAECVERRTLSSEGRVPGENTGAYFNSPISQR